jgi:putative endonuclease
MWFVYLLKCSDNSNYTGCTQDLEERVKCHNSGYVESTKEKLPVEVIMYFAFKDKVKAFQFEKYLKSGSGRAFKNKHLI